MAATLVLPSSAYAQSYRSYIAELADEERYPFQLDFEHADFAALLLRLQTFSQGIDIPEGYVPTSTYWLVEGDELLGVSSLRHHLNERSRARGGHIGLGIRPSRRGQGLGSRLLALTIQKARDLGMGELHIHCHKGNEASGRMIVRNGGVLESELPDDNPAETVQRYLVSVGR